MLFAHQQLRASLYDYKQAYRLRPSYVYLEAISTNDGLSGSAENIGKLLNRNNYFFVPFRQDNPITKPRSLVFDSSYIIRTLETSLDKEQIQPIIL